MENEEKRDRLCELILNHKEGGEAPDPREIKNLLDTVAYMAPLLKDSDPEEAVEHVRNLIFQSLVMLGLLKDEVDPVIGCLLRESFADVHKVESLLQTLPMFWRLRQGAVKIRFRDRRPEIQETVNMLESLADAILALLRNLGWETDGETIREV